MKLAITNIIKQIVIAINDKGTAKCNGNIPIAKICITNNIDKIVAIIENKNVMIPKRNLRLFLSIFLDFSFFLMKLLKTILFKMSNFHLRFTKYLLNMQNNQIIYTIFYKQLIIFLLFT